MSRQSDPEEQADAQFASSVFAGLDPIEPSATVARRVAQIPLEHPRQGAVPGFPWGKLWQPALGLAAAAALGIAIGSWTVSPPSPAGYTATGGSPAASPPTDEVESNAETSELDTLFQVALAGDWEQDLVDQDPFDEEQSL